MMQRTPIALALLALATLSHTHAGEQTLSLGAWGKQATVRFSSAGEDAAAPRGYTQTTDLPLRPGDPQTVRYTEQPDLPRVRSGSLAFDALFALAGAEMKQNAVTAIRDDSYNGGQPVPCPCFETGEKWHYVWTRDLSYAADLGLALLDQARVRDSLLFKLSGYRAGVTKAPQAAGTADGLQIVQDTGSGGSWPVSTDRVAWAFGADAALKTLAPAERAAFASTALKALANTIENDRIAAFDAAAGLYNGEQSFLDWRDQTYAAWVPANLPHMATSKALSTNVAHYQALTLAARLAREAGDTANVQRWEGWAAQLKDAINARFWLADAGMYASMTAGHFDGAPLHRFDWLGQALAIVTGIADPEQARSILARYPHGPMGAPVIWPQQPGQPVYHSRAIWPFVTAYGLHAAIANSNVAVADAAYDTLIRAAAVTGSNMENLEWLSGQPLLQHPGHPELDGPVVNSRRQLWSVGGYLGAVISGVFGVDATHDGLVVRPFITARLRGELFRDSDSLTLSNLTVRGKRLHVRIALPPPAQVDGFHTVKAVTLNGKEANFPVKWDELPDDARIEITLGELQPGRQEITRVAAAPLAQDSRVTAPPEPAIAALRRADGKAVLTVGGTMPAGVAFNVWRDGRAVAKGVTARSWTDPRPTAGSCYAIEAVHVATGLRSHHSAPACLGEPDAIVVERSLPDWGKPDDRLTVGDIDVTKAGTYQVQVRYRNNANRINLGISGGVKWLRVMDGGGTVVAEGVVQLPHTPAGAALYSTPLPVRLQPGRHAVQLSDFHNMSYLQSNATYADAGGTAGPSNRFDVLGLRLLPTAASTLPAVARGTLELIEKVRSPQLGNERTLRVWLPPGYAANPGKRYPVLYMHDGQNLFDPKTAYSTEWHIDEVADRLAANGAMREIIVVGIDNTPDRVAEYTECCDARWGGGKVAGYAAFVVDTVKPLVDARYRTLPGREHTAVMGSSMGGLASVAIAERYPQRFGMAGSLSGSFWWNNGTQIETAPARLPVRFYLDAGTAMDGVEFSRAYRSALLARGYRDGRDLLYHEDVGGIHNERDWASRVHRALTWFFPATGVRGPGSVSGK
ncbi:alpha/beta hydrolase-fold protein [Pseudoduganella chitinolytica]|uniref:Alpha/beta hydrolase-fold protein n=1 Tax=Pseudoduganella chitinolytica TaxID=34070 RepID=A0ABY8BAT7_9BURK|nr:alpha/beta hydrolase-fold protein [Pseudoduganella chitinolytica]WEF33031.1 alpha/beta hydrolase-fold protein [Pseudoduganella chitinolytica]